MRRFISSLCLVAVCAAWLWGCGPSANRVAGKSWFQRSQDKNALFADNPLRERKDAKRARAEQPGDSADVSETMLAKSPSPPTASKTANLEKFDEETLRLIEEELANTPPEERDQFYKDVISLQPAMVRQIIHTRRIVRQVGQEAPSSRLISPGQMTERTAQGIEQVSGEAPSETGVQADPSRNVLGRDPARDPGLGAVDPWQRPTQTDQPSASGGWTNDPNRPPAPLPFNQIPSLSGTGHSAGYVSGESNGDVLFRQQNAPTQIQPPPGGALSPVSGSQAGISARPNTPRISQNARVPNDYNPQTPPVPNYGQNGQDPFAANAARMASSNPDQPLPGIASGLDDSFGPPNNLGTAGTPGNNADLARLIAGMEAEVAGLRYADQTEPADKTAFIQKHVYLRMLYLMAGQEARAVTAIPDIPPADQEFWQQTFWAMSNYFDTNAMPDSEYRATQTIAQLRTAIQKLRENARLELRNVAFCHKISSFGNFDRFPQDEFGPGQPVLVYAEVVNFKSKPTTLPNKPNETFYRTQLKSSIEIHRLGPSGELVERFDFEPTEDLCHSPRRDYFHSYEFTIPQRISLGPHVMTLTVEDQLNRKVATYRLNFMVK